MVSVIDTTKGAQIFHCETYFFKYVFCKLFTKGGNFTNLTATVHQQSLTPILGVTLALKYRIKDAIYVGEGQL